MKKWLTLVGVLVLILAGCNQTQPTTSSADTTGSVPEEQPAAFTFSAESGIYPEEFSLSINIPEGCTVRYTTDGSDPATSQTALIYESEIPITDRKQDKNVVSAVDPVLISGNYNRPTSNKKDFFCTAGAPDDASVDKCTVIRAALLDAQGNLLSTQSATYFIGTAEEHIQGLAQSCAASGMELAVISISMNYEDLFDSATGIYVKGDIFNEALLQYLQYHNRVTDGETARSLDANYKQRGREWERQATITFFEFSPDGARAVLTQDCGIRIQGNYSRSDLQKGFRLFARSEYGESKFRYPVFGTDYRNDAGEVMDSFDTLVLRNGGNCAFTSKFNDTFWQSLLHNTACDTKHSRPCVVYLNGEYWGLYVLEEDYTDDYLNDVHGVAKDNVVIYKGDAESYAIGYKLDEGEIPAGQEEDYYFRPLLDFFATHDSLKSQEDYDAFCQLVDPESVRDYFAVQCWINNKWDWPGKNWSMWRTLEVEEGNPYGDGRWRFMFYDMEFGGVSGSSDARVNTIKEDNYKPHGLLDMDTSNPAVLCFAYLMTNEGFRQDFYDTLTGLSQGAFRLSIAYTALNEMEKSYAPLFDQFFARYPGTGNSQNATKGGYASVQCIRDFLSQRADNIQAMIDYCEKILG